MSAAPKKSAVASLVPSLDQDTDHYRNFFDLSMDMFCIASFDGRFIKLNRAWEEQLGYSIEELEGRRYFDFIHPEDLEKSNAEAERLSDGAVGSIYFENRYRCKDGSYRWILWRSRTDFEKGVIYAIARDVTREKESVQRLREAQLQIEESLQHEMRARADAEEQRERLHDLFTQVPALAGVTKGPEHRFVLANPHYIRLMGGRDLVGKTVCEAIPGLDPKILEILNGVYREGERFVGMDFPMKGDWQANGHIEEKYFNFIYEPTRDASGAVDGIWVLAFDVTEHRRMEEKLRSTERLAALGTLAAGIAHEINNPLSYSLGYLNIILDHYEGNEAEPLLPDPAAIPRMLKKVEHGLERVQEIVRGLKVFSRHDDSRVEPIDVHDAVKEAIEIAANEIRHRARLVEDHRGTPPVLANSGRLCQVFLNLLINSAQAIQEGAADANTITVRTRTGEGGEAVIEIEDTGAGIPPEAIPRLFEPFFTSKPVGVGTGLGLPICHGIVTSLGGQIQVRSRVGSGTTMTVVLPPAKDSVLPRPARAASPDPAAVPRLRLLVIDDEKELRELLVRAMPKHDVVAAGSAKEALEIIAAAQAPFDHIICDLMMPEMTGMDFHEHLARRGDGLEKRIIFMTGGAFTSRMNEWLSRTPNPRLQKPFRVRELAELLASCKTRPA